MGEGPLWTLPPGALDDSQGKNGAKRSAAPTPPAIHPATAPAPSGAAQHPKRRPRYRAPRWNPLPGGLATKERHGTPEYYRTIGLLGNRSPRRKKPPQSCRCEASLPLSLVVALDRLATAHAASRADVIRILLAEGIRLARG